MIPESLKDQIFISFSINWSLSCLQPLNHRPETTVATFQALFSLSLSLCKPISQICPDYIVLCIAWNFSMVFFPQTLKVSSISITLSSLPSSNFKFLTSILLLIFFLRILFVVQLVLAPYQSVAMAPLTYAWGDYSRPRLFVQEEDYILFFHIKVGEEEYNCQGDKSSIRSYDYRMGTKTFLVIDCFEGLVPEKPFRNLLCMVARLTK